MLSDEEFEAVVDEALAEIPEDLAEKIENIDIFIEDYPSSEVQSTMGVGPRGLLGFYHGVPRQHRGPAYGNTLPDRIYLYKKNIESISTTRDRLKEEIQRTVLHELGHYFGIDDKRLRELGF
ncbi:MAG: metallopeptidase family protein [Deltaproteobacteria bacterium]|nr:metallopeptidase family protein [Deltaproteobacteria bacterium]